MKIKNFMTALLASAFVVGAMTVSAMAQESNAVNATIKDAIEATAGAESATITIPAGEYSIADFALTTNVKPYPYAKNLKIEAAENADVTIKLDSQTKSYQNGVAYQYFVGGAWYDCCESISFDGINFVFEDTNTTDSQTMAEIQTYAKNSISYTDCTFDNVSISPWGDNTTGKVAACVIDECTFKNISARSAIHQSKALNLTVTECEFDDVASGIHISGNELETLTVTGNTFEGIANNSAAIYFGNESWTGKWTGDYSEADITVTSNTSDAALVRNGNESLTVSQMTALSDETANEFKTAFTDNSVEFVAVIGNVAFTNLQAAFDAVEDGQTITLINDVVVNEETRYNNNGYYDGAYYEGDASFIVDLNGYTITQDGALNDYLLLFKNAGGKDNEITFKNGTIDAGTTAYCALCTSTTSTKKITINLNNVDVIGDNRNGAVIKIRGGSVLNVNSDTVITGKDNYVGIEVVGSATVVNIFDGAEIYQNGTSSYVGSLAGVSNGATLNVYGGYGKSVQGGFIAMTSGGTVNVYGGEWIANKNGANAGDNHAVLISQSQKGAKSTVNVEGGLFFGGFNCYGDAVGDAQILVSGGTFTSDPRKQNYLIIERGYSVAEYDDGKFAVVENAKLDNNIIKVSFAKADVDNGTDNLEGEDVYNIILKADEDKVINRLNSADLTFLLTTDDTIAYEIIDIENDNISINSVNNSEDRYEFPLDTKTEVTNDTAKEIVIGQVKFTGYGDFTFGVDTRANDTNAAHATEALDNIVDTYIPNGDTANGEGKLDVSDSFTATILVPTRDLTINLTFPNAVENKSAAYQQMKVTVSGGDLDEAIVVELGSDAVMPVIATDVKPSAKVEVTADSVYQVVLTNALTADVAYNVEISGAGYRTTRYTVTMQGEDKDGKVLNFWNNVKDNETAIEEGKKTAKVTYLAGDIVKDSLINIYDLSAVVSYFGEEMDTDEYNAYAKYDLNRDGKIDSKDVAYVLVSWGN